MNISLKNKSDSIQSYDDLTSKIDISMVRNS